MLCFRFTTHLFKLLVCETVEFYDEFAVCGRDLSAGVDDLDDVQLLSQTHLCADLPTQVLNVLNLEEETHTQGDMSFVPFVQGIFNSIQYYLYNIKSQQKNTWHFSHGAGFIPYSLI